MPGTYQYDVEIKSNVAKLLSDMKQVQDRLDTVEGKEYKIKLNVDEKKLSNVISNLEKMLDSLGKGTGDFKQLESLSKELSSIATEVQSLSKAFGKVDDSGAKTLLSSIQNIDRSLSELSQNILNVNKNMSNMGGNTNSTVRQVENIGNAAADAVKQVDKLADAQSKLGGNKTNISSGMKDAFQRDNSTIPNTSSSAIKEENNVLDQTVQSAEKAANSKKKFTKANQEVKASADESASSIKNENNAFDQNEWDKNVKAIQDYMNAVTKLNNLQSKDKGSGKYSNQIELQMKNIETLKQAAYDARANLSSMVNPHDLDITTWDKWLDAIKQFDQASLGSAESVAKLEDAINSMMNSFNNKASGYESKLATYQATAAKFADGGWTSDTYKNQIAELNESIGKYKALLESIKNNSEIVSDEDITKLNQCDKEIKEIVSNISNMSSSQKGYTFLSGQKELDKIRQILKENSAMSREAKNKIKEYYNQIKSGNPSASLDVIHAKIMQIVDDEAAAGRAGKSMLDVIGEKAWYGLAGTIGTYFGLNDVIRYGQQAAKTIIDLDTTLIDLKKTTSMTSNELEDFYYDSNDVAKQMGVTTQEIIEQASAWSRLGYNTKEASTEMAKLSSQFASISPGMDTDTAQEGLVSIMKAWNIDYSDVKAEIMDNINALGNSMAENNQDIVEGMERSAAALAAVGTSYKDAFAMFSGIQEVLQNAEVSGRALRSISMRIRGYDESTEELSSDLENITGELVDLTKTAEHSQGISIFKDGSTTEFKSLVDYFGEISQIWDEMSQKQQNDFLQKAFGKTQAQAGAALIQNFSAVTKSLEVMDNAAGSSDKEMSTIEQSIEYKLNALKETWVGTVQDILDRGDVGKAVDALTGLSEGIGFVISKLGLLKTAALGIGAVLSIKNVGRDKMYSHTCFECADNMHNLLWIHRFRVCYL